MPPEMEDAPNKDSRYIVPGLRRGLAILRLFNDQRKAISPPDIARELGIPRATAFRLVYTLESDGLLERLPNSNAFQLGVGVLSLGFEYLGSLDIAEIGRPILEDLRDRTDASTHMGILDGTSVVYIVSVASTHRLRNHVSIGSRMPAHATSTGRALLLDKGRQELGKLYKGAELRRFSDRTPGTIDALCKRLENERAKGYVSYKSEFSSGIASIAAPVRNHAGSIVAGINVSDYESLPILQDMDGGLKDEVLKAALQISLKLGYKPK